mgnify:CR=1 FL=1
MEDALQKLALETVADPDGNTKQAESFEVIDYVRELFLNSEEQKKLEQKKYKLLRICVALASVVALVVIVSAAVLVPSILRTVSQVNDTLVSVQKVDIVAVAQNIDTLAIQATDTFDTVGQSVKVLDELDMESLNATIAELKTGVESFSKIDFETLNSAITSFNATITPIAKFFGKK